MYNACIITTHVKPERVASVAYIGGKKITLGIKNSTVLSELTNEYVNISIRQKYNVSKAVPNGGKVKGSLHFVIFIVHQGTQ